MGIQLPPELTDVAAKAGVRWPEADEDAMLAAAGAWRDAAHRVGGLATQADGSAQQALGAVAGGTADAARRHWDSYVAPDTGHLTAAQTGCHAAADRLEHAANQVGTAKVEIVRQLVSLAKVDDAANQAAASGHVQAAAGVDTAVRGTAANVAHLHGALTDAVRLDNGVSIRDTPVPVQNTPGVHAALDAPRPLGDAPGSPRTEPPGGGSSPLPQPLPQTVSQPLPQTVSQAHLPHIPEEVHQASAAVLDPVAAPASSPWSGAQVGYGTGLSAPAPAAAPLAGPVAGGLAFGPAAGPVAGGSPFGPAAGPIAGAPVGGGPVAGGPVAGGPVAGGPGPGGQGGAPAPAPVQPDTRWDRGTQARDLAMGSGVPHPNPPAGQTVVPAPGPQQKFIMAADVTGAQRTWPTPSQGGVAGSWVDPGTDQRHGPASGQHQDAVALFLFYLFPIGHLPVPSNRPARQLPPPSEEIDYAAGLRFPPHDHPEAALVDDADALAGRRPALPSDRPAEDSAEDCVVAELVRDHDPLGAGHERDWDRRFLVRPADDDAGLRAEYAWPPAMFYPEGGRDSEPVVLDEGVELDRFGDPAGRVFADADTPFARRSLPPEYLGRGYHRYRVLRRLPVWRTVSAAWFAQPGGGVRYRSTYPVVDLVALGYLRDITQAEVTAGNEEGV